MCRKSCISIFTVFIFLFCPTLGFAGDQKQEEGPAGYVQAEKDPSADEMQKSIAQIEDRVEQLQQEIAKIRDKALNNNPELESLLRELVLTRNDVMHQNLAQQDVDPEELKTINTQLQDQELSEEKKAKLQENKKNLFIAYKKAEIQTDQSEQIQKLRKKFYSQLLEAAQKENPHIQEKLEELQRLQHQLKFAKKDSLPEK